jgi:hypothetical protein
MNIYKIYSMAVSCAVSGSSACKGGMQSGYSTHIAYPLPHGASRKNQCFAEGNILALKLSQDFKFLKVRFEFFLIRNHVGLLHLRITCVEIDILIYRA